MFTFALFLPLSALIGWKFATVEAWNAGGLKEYKTQGAASNECRK